MLSSISMVSFVIYLLHPWCVPHKGVLSDGRELTTGGLFLVSETVRTTDFNNA